MLLLRCSGPSGGSTIIVARSASIAPTFAPG
jgi:hypothetical protein